MQGICRFDQFRFPAHVSGGLQAVHVQDGRKAVLVGDDPEAAVGVHERGADVFLRNGRIDLLPLVVQHGLRRRVDDIDARTARDDEQETAARAPGHQNEFPDELHGLRLPGVLQVETAETAVLGVEDRQAGGRPHPFHAMVVLAEVVDGVAQEGKVVVPVMPEFLESHAVETQETALRAYPQEILPVLADPVDLGVGKAQLRSIEPGGLCVGRIQ